MRLPRYIMPIMAAGVAATAWGVPAKRGLFPVTQPDGSVIMVQRVGDEHLHFLLTEDRQLLTRDTDGTFSYARITDDGSLVSTRVKATPAATRTNEARAVTQSVDVISLKEVKSRRTAAKTTRQSRAITQTGMGRFSGNFPRTGKVKGLVILVEYQDTKFNLDDPHTYFNNMLNQESFSTYGGTGSARDYFLQNSNGLFDPEFDVYGPYTLSQKRAAYGANNEYDEDIAPEEMIVESCRGLDSQINFADYDMDGDGWVDNVFVFYAGQGEASYGPEDSVWPHQWELEEADKVITLDGKKISKYACTNEWEDSRPDGVGTFIHEFSHVMGLPDLYETTYESGSVTPGEWSVLDYGPYNNDGRTPPNYSIFERNAMGWCEPEIIDGPASVALENFASTNRGCIIPTTRDTEFFLLENRQLEGWDKYLPGHGLLVWHVDFNQSVWDNNAVNNDPNHMYVELEKADGPVKYDKYYDLPIVDGWSFPGTSGNTSFTNNTVPSMGTWNGTPIDMPLTDITESGDGIITFDVAGGLHIAVPILDETINITSTCFTVSWQPVEGATDYLVTVTHGKESPAVIENYDSKNLPQGWNKNFNDIYDTNSNYVTANRSLKFCKSNHTLTTRTYDNDVTYLSFWYKGNSTTSNSTMSIKGMINNNWVNISSITPKNNETKTKEITNIPAGVKAIKFVYTKSTGNMAIDDITVKTGGSVWVTVPGYDGHSTGNSTNCTVDLSDFLAKLDADAQHTFTVSVQSTDGEYLSGKAQRTVDMTDQAGIDNVTIDSNNQVEYYNLQGIRISNPQPGHIYIRRQQGKSELVRN